MAAGGQATQVVQFSIQFSSLALLYYDYGLTWTREVKYFWTKKFTLSTLLYFACRYALVANIVYLLVIAGKLPAVGCDTGYQICSSLSIIGRGAILTVWGARTYAVFNKNKWVLALFTSLGLSVFVFGVLHVPNVSCTGSKGGRTMTDLLAIFTVVYEVFSAVFATIRGYQALRITRQHGSMRKGLTHIVFEQGLLYFFFVTTFSVAALVLQFVSHHRSSCASN